MTITNQGVYDIPEAAYHADPCAAPSLSNSIAKVLLDQSPRHAWTQHPRLNPDFKAENKAAFDLGSAAHALMLGSHEDFCVVDAGDWRTKEAKEKRDQAYAEGKIPLLVDKWKEIEAMVAAGKAQLAAHEDARGAFTSGRAEQTLIWREGEVWCRSRLDWMPESGVIFYDYKTTAQSAHPDDFARTVANLGYDVQCAFYRRGIRAVLGIDDPEFHFVVQETAEPYALSVIALPPAWIDMAERKVMEAIRLWGHCTKHDQWPGYPARTAYIEPPAWVEAKWLDREARDDLARTGGGDKKLFQMLIDWQAPHRVAAEKEGDSK